MKKTILFLFVFCAIFGFSVNKAQAERGDVCYNCGGCTLNQGTCSGTDGLTLTKTGCVIYEDGHCGPVCETSCTRNEDCTFSADECTNGGTCRYTPPAGNCDNSDCEKTVSVNEGCDGQPHGACSSIQKRVAIVKRYWFDGTQCKFDQECYNVRDVCEPCPENTPIPSLTPTRVLTPTPTLTPTLTPRPTATPTLLPCDADCVSDSQCGRLGSSIKCITVDVRGIKRCRDQNCPEEERCACSIITPTLIPSPTPTSVPVACLWVDIVMCRVIDQRTTCRPLYAPDLGMPLKIGDKLTLTVHSTGSAIDYAFGVKITAPDGATTERRFLASQLGNMPPAGANWIHEYTIANYGAYEFQVNIQDKNGIWHPGTWY